MPLGWWVHLAGTYDGSAVRAYINGDLVAETPLTGALCDGNDSLYFGLYGWRGTGSEFVHGFLDEVRIWNVARSSEDLKQDMNHPLTGSESGLLGYWNLDEGNGQIVNDLSPAQNHGVLGQSQNPEDYDPGWILPLPTPTPTSTPSPTVTLSPTATPLACDVDQDGIIDCGDVLLVMGVWHLPLVINPASRSDISGDGFVDKDDLLLLAGQWRKGKKHTPTPTVTFTPTPTLTSTATRTQTVTNTPTLTFTPTHTPTRTSTPAPTNTPREHPLRGRYDIWMTGDDTGTGQIRVYDDGSVVGTIDSDGLQTSVDVSGSVDRRGDVDAKFIYKGTEIGTAWGHVSTNGTGGGNWENVWYEEGEWIAIKIQD